MTAEYVIGREGVLPWEFPEDLRLFREWTMGGTLIMGRRTFRSLPEPLDGRNNLVLSRTLAQAADITVCRSWTDALEKARRLGADIWVMGGAEVYRIALGDARQLVVSWVKGNYPGDTRFPSLWSLDWKLLSQTPYQGFIQCRYRRSTQSHSLAAKQSAGLLTAPFAGQTRDMPIGDGT